MKKTDEEHRWRIKMKSSDVEQLFRWEQSWRLHMKNTDKKQRKGTQMKVQMFVFFV